jgi:ABC-type bacteriocin/lantibiotic exporter with double-glycine peptidase domain
MKTKEQIYNNLYNKAKENAKTHQGVIEFFIALIVSLLFALFAIHYFPFINPYLAFLPFVASLILIASSYNGKSIWKVSTKTVIKEMRRAVDIEIQKAHESNFSSDEQIQKLEEIKKDISGC